MYSKDWRAAHPGQGAQEISLKSSLGDSIDARWYAATTPGASLTFVGFPGNGDTADSMDPAWQALRSRANVLAVNAPGYGATDVPKDRTRIELHMMANLQAVQSYVLKDKATAPHDCVWYGFSLGGSQATKAFAEVPGSHLILQNTFTSAREVIGNAMSNVLGSSGHRLSNRFARTALPIGLSARELQSKTNGLDTRRQLEDVAFQGKHQAAGSQVHIFIGGQDKLMPIAFGKALLQAYCGSSVGAVFGPQPPGVREEEWLAADGRSSLFIDQRGCHTPGEEILLRVVKKVGVTLDNISNSGKPQLK